MRSSLSAIVLACCLTSMNLWFIIRISYLLGASSLAYPWNLLTTLGLTVADTYIIWRLIKPMGGVMKGAVATRVGATSFGLLFGSVLALIAAIAVGRTSTQIQDILIGSLPAAFAGMFSGGSIRRPPDVDERTYFDLTYRNWGSLTCILAGVAIPVIVDQLKLWRGAGLISAVPLGIIAILLLRSLARRPEALPTALERAYQLHDDATAEYSARQRT